MTTLIQQREAYDCGVACIAMALKVTYEGALMRVNAWGIDYTKGMTDQQVADIIGAEVPIDQSEFLVIGVPQVMTVPSLNRKGEFHFIWYDGVNVYDPNWNTGKRAYFGEVTELFPFVWGIHVKG